MNFKLRINENTSRKTDEKSIEKTIRLLKGSGCKNVGDLNTIDKYSTFDISGYTQEDIPFVAEVKDKDIPHDKYGDVLCDKAKIDKYKTQPFYEKMLVFNYYNDGYLAIANPDHGYRTIKRETPISTFDSDIRKGTEIQELAKMKQERIMKVN